MAEKKPILLQNILLLDNLVVIFTKLYSAVLVFIMKPIDAFRPQMLTSYCHQRLFLYQKSLH